ncbi:Ycf22 (chloroplast) [Porphyra umbilicalis]|uniref:Ycf22 n=1 Tax=Porphyra umbilicalis TaxID=2786 RepID=J7F7L8_PORUM|nr:Ycf22 [Porphyra umbilicalis]AFC40040.1 Ycf22 [Porphyra umbilicalis]ASN78844.1 Ycf22 [Porphyra umbilicalis]|eukprot:ASN78844.1 Ycf22 (chloroplast) [Porphyra umbilicalis]
MKRQYKNTKKEFLGVCFLGIVTLFSVSIWHVINRSSKNKSYKVFVEFDSAYGIQEGTSVRLRGLPVGKVVGINQSLSTILTSIEIQSCNTIIPKASLIETNQTGLLNDTIIDIVPLNIADQEYISLKEGPLSKTCNSTQIICHLNYLQGERGLNYDDLIRATTRISQRFDDPELFYGLYYMIGNILKLSSNLVDCTEHLASISHFFRLQLEKK